LKNQKSGGIIEAGPAHHPKEAIEMALTAYVLINANPGQTGEVATKVKGITGVKSAHAITGPFDVIAYVEAEDLNSLGRTVISKIQAIAGVARTTTCPTVEL
jgi:DNA-binding Lrp family transcriptional regulator